MKEHTAGVDGGDGGHGGHLIFVANPQVYTVYTTTLLNRVNR